MRRMAIVFLTSAVAVASVGVAEGYTLAESIRDEQKVYWGAPDESFEKPAEVKFEKIVTATPEYEQVKKKKVEPGTAKYWILMSKASEHAVRLIEAVGAETDYDLITAQGYLGGLEPPIPATDVTDLVLAKLEDGKKK